MQSLFFTKYSTPDQTVVTTMTQMHSQPSRSGISRCIRHRQTMVEAVFTFPDQPAAMTRPPSPAMSRRPGR